MSNHVIVVQGTSANYEIDLVDTNGELVPMDQLSGATAEFILRVQPSDTSNVLDFQSANDPAHLSFSLTDPVLTLAFAPTDTTPLSVRGYFYQVRVTLESGRVLPVIDWTPFDITLGGSATPTPPPFDNTVKINQDYQLPGDLSYMTPAGTPIQSAQVRLYFKSDYDVGNLASPVGVTMTNAAGGWINPILVLPGYSYVVRFEKPNEWGPNTAEIFA